MTDFPFTLSMVDLYFAFPVANLFSALSVFAFLLTNLFFSLADLLLIGFFVFVADLSLIEFLSIGRLPFERSDTPTYCCAQSPHPFQVATSHLAPPVQLSNPSQLVTVIANLKHLLQIPSTDFAKLVSFSLNLLVELNCL